MLSMDVEKGYRNFRLAPEMRTWFIFHYQGRYLRCVSLIFGWGRSPLLFAKFNVVFVRKLRRYWFRVLAYLDDLLVVRVAHGVVEGPLHFLKGIRKAQELMYNLGLTRKIKKEEWCGSKLIEHLRVVIDSKNLIFGDAEEYRQGTYH